MKRRRCGVQPLGGCPKWCDYSDARNHPETHIAHCVDVTSSGASLVKIVAITAESRSVSIPPGVVISMLRDDSGRLCTAQLSWSSVETLAAGLVEARRRFA